MVGVLEAVNKKNGSAFTADDERTLQSFAVFCGLIIHNSNLQKDIKRLEQHNKVYMSISSYIKLCKKHMTILQYPERV